MKLSVLKKIRVITALIFFLLTAVIFLDFSGSVSPLLYNKVTYLQLIPSVIKFFTIPGLLACGFIFVLVLTLMFGRVYCSTICPMGTLQDIISFINRKLQKKKFYYFVKEQAWTRYSILGISVVTAAAGYVILLNLLDPFSNAGKIFVNMFRPLLINGNNIAAALFESAGLYILYPYEIKHVNYAALIYPALFFITVFMLVYRNGRLFCNIICPAGTLLGFVSKYSIFKISIDEKNCRSCKLCERVCKGGCINKAEKEVDFTRCVACYNCFTVCPSNGIIYTHDKKESTITKSVDSGRRNFALKTAAAVLSSAGINLAQLKNYAKKEKHNTSK